MHIRHELRPGHLLVVAGGEFDQQVARKGLGEALRVCQANALTRIFVDGRGITTPVSIADRYDLATLLAEHGRGRLRMAILVSPENMFTKTLEDTATNRGAYVRTTDSLDEAMEYLGLAGAP